MNLSEIYQNGKAFFKSKEYGRLLGYVETGFIEAHDRRIVERYTFRQKGVDATVARTGVRVLGVDLATPVVMSAMTMVGAEGPRAVTRDVLIDDWRGIRS